MPANSFGELFRFTTFGESHGPGVGVIIDGVTPGVALAEADIQKEMDRRKPGQSSVTTPRKESDRIRILSGVFEGKTTGTPLAVLLYNTDMDPGAYSDIKNLFRPGHADYTYLQKYGRRDYRGSGRASGRETAGRVAAGAVAAKILARDDIRVRAYTLQAAGIECRERDWSVIEDNPMRACDPAAAEQMQARVEKLAEQGDSTGGIVECRINGVPAGIGEPAFDKLEALLGHAMLSLGGIKGIEFGAGFACAGMRGSEHNDALSPTGFVTNNAGGLLGGISNGDEIVFRLAVKPTSSISLPQETVDRDGKCATIRTEGRHDPCLCPRMVPVVEAMAAVTILDLLKRQEALRR